MNLSRVVHLKIDRSKTSFDLESNRLSIHLDALDRQKPKAVISVVDSNGVVVRHVHNWLHHLIKGAGISIAESTITQYANSILYLCRWLEEARPYPSLQLNEALTVINRRDIQSWHQHQGERVQANTLNNREVVAKEFLTWLTTIEGGEARQMIDSPWGRDNKLPYVAKRSSPKSPKYITPDEIIALLKMMHNEAERCMFHTQYDTGLRIAELISLTRGDLPTPSLYADQNVEFVPLYIKGVKGIAGNQKERVSVISRAVLNRIKNYHSTLAYRQADQWSVSDPNKPVFLTSNGLPWSQRNAQKQFKNAVRRSGVDDDFVSHWLRHGTAFSVLTSDIGKDYTDRMLTIQGMLGHAHIKTTEIYTQISPALLAMLDKEGKRQNRLDEAQRIRSETYLAPLKHTEKRGKYGR